MPCATDKEIARGGWAEDAALRRCSFPIGPRNTWSNLAYIWFGLLLPVLIGTPASWVMAGAMIALGIGSGLYHGTKKVWANNLDWFGMYLTMTVLVIHGLFPNAPGLAFGAACIAIVMASIWSFDKHFDAHMGILLIAAALPPALHGQLPLVALSFTLFGLGYVAWQFDKARKVVGLWGHALWHVLTAGAQAALFVAQFLASQQ